MESKSIQIGSLILLACSVALGAASYARFQALESRLNDLGEMSIMASSLETEVERLRSELEDFKRSSKPPIVAVRIDDVHDYAYRDAQLFLLRYSTARGIPVSLAIIPKLLESDRELIVEVADALKIGSEVSAHGWEHEDLTKLTLEDQVERLAEAKITLRRLFGINASILVPPTFKFNDDTLLAMRQAGYEAISSSIELGRPGIASHDVVSVPATVEFSDFVNGTWRPKSAESLYLEVVMSIGKYGYAVIVLHPQEFMSGGELDQNALRTCDALINRLSEDYSFTTLKELTKVIS